MSLKVSLLVCALLLPALSSAGSCGDSVVGSGFIVGGDRIHRGQWPFLAALFRAKSGTYFCAGSVITKRHVISAGKTWCGNKLSSEKLNIAFVAHCMQPKYWDKKLNSTDLVVHLGRYNISKAYETNIAIHEVSEIVMHPQWRPFEPNYDADLAILKLNESIEDSSFVKVVCWPSSLNNQQIGEGVVVSKVMERAS